MQKLKAILEKFKSHTNYFILAFIVLNAALTVHLFLRQGVNNKLIIAIALLVEALFELGLVVVFYKLKKKRAPLEKYFLWFYIPIGLLFIFLMPHQQTPDSYAHLTRAYEVSNGVLVAQPAENGMNGATLPVEIRHYIEREENYQYELDAIGTTLSGETYLEQEQYPAASGYIFVLYLPHAIGILIGRLLGMSVYFFLLLGRILCMLAFGIMAYFAIKLAPRFKIFLMFLAMLPMTLQQTTAFTADAMTFGVAFLLVGYALYLIYDEKVKTITNRQIVGIYGIAAAMALCKVVYFPLMGLFVLIPWRKFGSKKRKWLHGLLAVGVAVALEILWMKLQATEQGTLPITDQFTFIVQHPLRYITYMVGTAMDYLSTFYVSSTFGMSLGAWKFDLPNAYFFMAAAMAAVVFTRGTEHFNVKPGARWMSWGIFTVVVVAFMTTMFTQWTKPGLNYVDGVQGRYFIPILPLIPLMFSFSKKKKDEKPTLPFQYPLLFNMFFCVIAMVTILAVNLGR